MRFHSPSRQVHAALQQHRRAPQRSALLAAQFPLRSSVRQSLGSSIPHIGQNLTVGPRRPSSESNTQCPSTYHSQRASSQLGQPSTVGCTTVFCHHDPCVIFPYSTSAR